jgi:peptide deformylase
LREFSVAFFNLLRNWVSYRLAYNPFWEQEVTEGCLSIPGYYGEIKRSAEVTVKGKDRRGKEIKIKATGLMAEALEHEIDHLNGVL